eukprot:CAMPEP_0198695336 /NCGR_PEP_ID=MMETSP1468-20131203/285968_1 /TAXON_ID=1461545 /ORGANISM="Mantoniella sp, Strain CCMP1436" /LENGTH=52 /DNA_ID=CAMNT_0044451001 /DNA_START=249 /DNA_END=403 /DNA_ORIENTATION=+
MTGLVSANQHPRRDRRGRVGVAGRRTRTLCFLGDDTSISRGSECRTVQGPDL